VLLGGSFKAAHDLQERAAAILAAQQVDVRVELCGGHGVHVLDPLQAH
jgi:hypothetical protein